MINHASIVRPVCTRLPDSISTWEATNLPLSCVLTPLQQQHQDEKIKTLTSIPKCLYCGAPHPTLLSHYPSYGYILCYLCGKTSSVRFDDQFEKRRGEGMSQRVYADQICSARSRSNGEVLEYNIPIHVNDKEIPTYEISAMKCPPLWWIVVEGSVSRSYWNSVGGALRTIIAELPPYVHVGLAVASGKSLSIWNVRSPVPYIKHYHGNQCPEVIFADVRTYQSHLQTALRAMADSMTTTDSSIPLIRTVEVLLDKIHGEGKAIGLSSFSNNKCLYAGGRILMILNGPPQEFKNSMKVRDVSETFGCGGRGGACFESGNRFAADLSCVKASTAAFDLREIDPEMGSSQKVPLQNASIELSSGDLTPTNLKKFYPRLKQRVLQKLELLGDKCAGAALGIDMLFVTQQPSPFIGLPFLKVLCEKTGTPGPILFDLFAGDILNSLQEEIRTRIPRFFGGLLKIRLSPGFKVDMSPMETIGKQNANYMLANSHIKKGLMGPGASTQQDSLWKLGVCDPMQTMMIDLQVMNKIHSFAFMDGLGEIAMKPCLQISFAYTTIVEDTENNDFKTVRRLRICTLHLPIVNNVESLYAAIDLEALSIVLMHKLIISFLTEGLLETQLMGKEWLKCKMICAYRSAQMEEKRQQRNVENGLGGAHGSQNMFHASDRLVNKTDGQLTRDQILLGEGHDILRRIPLIVWCILQCDAFRPIFQGELSLDARCAALFQMTSMNPSTFFRCIIPRVELWQSGNFAMEPIVTDLGLSSKNISSHIIEHQKIGSELILFLNAPYGIIVCDSRHFYTQTSPKNANDGVEIGDALKFAIQEAIVSYRTPPPVLYALDFSSATVNWSDYLTEESLNQNSQNFEDWKNDIAAAISKDLNL